MPMSDIWSGNDRRPPVIRIWEMGKKKETIDIQTGYDREIQPSRDAGRLDGRE